VSTKNQVVLDVVVARSLEVAETKRYHEERTKYRKSPSFAFEIDLNEDVDSDGEMPWLNDKEFLQKYRCSRASVDALYELIKDDPVFKSNNKPR